MFYDVNVSRISTATKTVGSRRTAGRQAEEAAVEQAHDEDFTGCVVDYDFEFAEPWKRRTRILPEETE